MLNLPTRSLTLVFLVLQASSVMADMSPLSPACQLLDSKDFTEVGFTLTGKPRGNSLNVSTEQSGAPSEIQADICFFYEGIEGGRISANVTVERFATMKGVPEWLETKNGKAGPGATLDRIDAAICEQGSYEFANPTSDDRGNQREQRYVACDTLAPIGHVIVQFEMPADGRQPPSPKVVKALLDKVVSRLPAPAR